MHLLGRIKYHQKLILIIIVILVATVFFETGQQYYYVTRFKLAEEVSFSDLFKNHAYKWIIWLLVSSVLVIYTRSRAKKAAADFRDILKYILLIFALVLINILIISVIQLWVSYSEFSWLILIEEFIPFNTFQKLPLYVLGYFFMAILLHFYFTSEFLQIKVQKFGEIKSLNSSLYENLRNSVNDTSSVLNVRIGKTQKIIPVENICWLEADDYCVKIHTVNQSSYVMRTSLKALDEKLGNDFIRVHRKAIVNIKMIHELKKNGQYNIIMSDQSVVPLAKSKVKFLNSILSNL